MRQVQSVQAQIDKFKEWAKEKEKKLQTNVDRIEQAEIKLYNANRKVKKLTIEMVQYQPKEDILSPPQIKPTDLGQSGLE